MHKFCETQSNTLYMYKNTLFTQTQNDLHTFFTYKFIE